MAPARGGRPRRQDGAGDRQSQEAAATRDLSRAGDAAILLPDVKAPPMRQAAGVEVRHPVQAAEVLVCRLDPAAETPRLTVAADKARPIAGGGWGLRPALTPGPVKERKRVHRESSC